MARVLWTDPVLRDVEATVRFIARSSPANAELVFDGLLEAPNRLAAFPYSGQVVPEFQVEHLREILFESFRLIYCLRGDTCWMVAVIHASREITALIDPEDWKL
jgi:toxin ParE1/3/4